MMLICNADVDNAMLMFQTKPQGKKKELLYLGRAAEKRLLSSP